MVTKIPIDGMSREEWLAERRKSLGGSDMGAVLGLNKYRSPYAVWAEKTGLIGETPDNEAMRQGRDLEEYAACRFEEASDKVVRRVNYILRNDDAPHLHANIDRRILKESAGLECKTASALSMKNYVGGEFPESYYAQCVTYLAVTGWKRWYLAALVLNKAFSSIRSRPCRTTNAPRGARAASMSRRTRSRRSNAARRTSGRLMLRPESRPLRTAQRAPRKCWKRSTPEAAAA